MMKRLFLAFIAIWLGLGAPAMAAITLIPGASNPFLAFANVGTGFASVTSSASTAAVPVGSLVYIALSERNNASSFTSCTDSVGNTYSAPTNNVSSSTVINAYSWGITTVLAPIGTTWTCNAPTAGQKAILISAASGVASSGAHDAASATPATSTGTAIAVGPTGTLACPAGGAGCEILYASWAYVSSGTDSSITAGYTLVGCDTGNNTNHCLYYQIVSASTALSFAATHSVSTVWAANLEAFAAAGAAPTLQGGLLLRGAGR